MSGQREKVLIVDDMEINRAILRSVLEEKYDILEAENGEQALLLLDEHQGSIAMVLLDVVMPGKNGYQVLEEMGRKGMLEKIPVVMVTAEGSAENEVRSFDLGASDIVMKPFEPHVVKRRVENIIELKRHQLHLEELVAEQARSIHASNEVITDALSSIIEYRSVESGQHVLRIRMFTKILLQCVSRYCQEYDLDDQKIDIISRAAAMHDIGKIAIPDAILNKPGRLTDEELEVMKGHTVKGGAMLASLAGMGDQEYLRYAYNICRYHHERWDGGGYPDALKGDNIPICAQVVGVADCYDALTTDRVYKGAYTHERAMNMILNGECGAFSSKLLECLKDVGEQFRDLAREYADGRSPGKDFTGKLAPVRPRERMDALELAQAKYYTLLRYQGATVLELDQKADIYHIVYSAGEDFDLLRSGNSFLEAFRRFVQTSVHPEDRKRVGEDFDDYLYHFFEDGLMKRSREYRVFQRRTGDYRWYRATTLRVDVDDPTCRKAILIWRDMGGERVIRRPRREAPERCSEALVRNIPGGVLQCRNDGALTVVRMGEGFTAMFGYTEQDVKERFQNHFLQMIHPADRAGVTARVREQLGRGSTVEVEYRVSRKDGGLLWVLDKGKLVEELGEEYLYCVLVDVTQTKKAQEELRLTLERHQIIMDQTNDIIFEWEMRSDQIAYSHNWEKKFGYPPTKQESSGRLCPNSEHIHPDDRKILENTMEALASGAPYAETEYRVACSDGRYLWCRTRATTQFGTDGAPIKVVGVIQDVEGERSRAQELKAIAEQDALTGLCNKASACRRVEHYLAGCDPADLSAMLILDVDNFKQINDRFGHMFGDAVLTQIADKVRGLFRGADIIARIGGDEFMVFLPQIPSTAVAAERAERIVETFQHLFMEDMEECPVSCSIGVAYAPEHGENFQDLFLRADRALYQAKNRGKNQYVVCAGEADLSQGFRAADSSLGARIDSDERLAGLEWGLVQYTFQVLCRSGDVEEAVRSILELVGRQFNVSRAYIFECSEDNTHCENTFEWCNEGVESQIGQLGCGDYGDIGSYKANFNEMGLFYCPDISTLPPGQYAVLEPRGIKSMLQCAIRDNGRFRGYVGFDECTANRLWTQDQIDALTFVSEMLSVFLLKKRAQDKTENAAKGMLLALDNQNSWIYIIDPDTYEMLFLNAKTRAIAPGAELGMPCYKVFFDRDTPCVRCPARDIRQTVNQTLEVYNPVLAVWSSADAALIQWEGRDACLLVCRDITPYKNELEKEEKKK